MNPGVRPVSQLRQDEQIVPTEGVCAFPLFAVPVKTGKGGVEPSTTVGVVLPDGRLDSAQTDLVNRFVFCHKAEIGVQENRVS